MLVLHTVQANAAPLCKRINSLCLQVVANAKVLAVARAGALPSASALKESTPGGLLVNEAAARPWVLNVDAMLSQFLQGGGAAGQGSGGGAGGQGRSGRGG